MQEASLPSDKICSRCQERKPLDDFHRRRRAKDGRAWYCKDCMSAYAKAWNAENREHNDEVSRRWYENNRDHVAERTRNWVAAHRERKAETDKRWKNLNRVRAHEVSDAWARRNPEKRAAHLEVMKAIQSGRLVRPDCCERCGDEPAPFADGRSAVEAHHHDYSKPLDVEWVCRSCHVDEHLAA